MPNTKPLFPTTMANIPSSPFKKRRFFDHDDFVDSSPSSSSASPNITTLPNLVVPPQEALPPHLAELRAVLGPEVSVGLLEKLYKVSSGNLDVAVNKYFEGSLKQDEEIKTERNVIAIAKENHAARSSSSSTQRFTSSIFAKKKTRCEESLNWRKRYIGELIVVGWSSFKGPTPLHPGDKVHIERTPPPSQPTAKRGKSVSSRPDTIVRFTTLSTPQSPYPVEVGRLPLATARYVSKLLDLGACSFDGFVVHCSDRLSTGDDVILQLRVFVTQRAFAFDPYNRRPDQAQSMALKRPVFGKTAETDQEREAKERRVALLAMLRAMGAKPIRAARSDAGEDAYRDNLVAAEEAPEGGGGKKRAGSEEVEEPEGINEEEKQISEEELDNLYEKAQRFDAALPEMEPPEGMVLELRSYQKQALSWMVSKELLKADTVDETCKPASLHPLWEEYVFPIDTEQAGIGAGEKEEDEFYYLNPYSGELSLKFQPMESMCRGGILADEMGLGKTIEILSLIHVNRPTLPLPSTTPTPSRTASPTTLIICPMSLLAQWRDELIRGSAPGSLTVEVYYGGAKDRHLRESCARWDGRAPDVVVTSYGTVMSEWCAEMGERGEGVFGIEWWRIVLDEAHQIKARMTKTARSCFALAAQRRWVVTGTPIQNKLEDLFSLVHFLRAEPWSNYTFWRTYISIPFQSKDARALSVVQTVLEPLVLRRTKAMKGADGNTLVELPEKTIDVDFLEFSPAEQEFYDNLFNVSKKKFTTLVGQGKVLSQYACIFQLLMRLRQICDHPYLVLGNKNAKSDDVGLKDSAVSLDDLIARFNAADGGPSYGASVLQRLMAGAGDGDSDGEEHECPICFEAVEGGVLMPCMHGACRTCVTDYLQKRENEGEEGQCPICRHGPITEGDLIEVVKNRPSSSDPASSATVSLRHNGSFRSSTKIDALLRHLATWRRERPQVKVVVFSQFTSLLSLVELALEREGIEFVRLDGKMSQLGREKVLKEFKEGKVGVILISLRAGGVGLNLTCASRVVMMDPWWNFAVEAQAIDRVHRLGQTEEVIVKRLIIKGSVEEKILAIQNRKNALASGLGMSKDEARLQRVEELKVLFG